ncbi:Arsenate-mycothiol transferase ArsC1 [Zancudomyces culisetae]|uniref:Arsenate-mycothiol transferase ArsC1 n=1 Tax=Zancudomyces culisetae TaxID=1213189 RepID=A0A1R1PND5_ZANCU|nr:Arsenate-mycothiol transferase ArsC1 [Zancudomyces culisetae]|eukprot:OMH82476.1 Arsenate-mycothiol transferase ArsC1 [Zancudomyces culisetae]
MEAKLCRPRVLFACIHNAGRSQIAAELYRAKGGFGISAGTNPSTHVHPNVERCMRELGFDLSKATPTKLTSELVTENKIDFIITMGCNEQCPYVPGVKIVAWNISDPKGMDDANTRAVINEIGIELSNFLDNCKNIEL